MSECRDKISTFKFSKIFFHFATLTNKPFFEVNNMMSLKDRSFTRTIYKKKVVTLQ